MFLPIILLPWNGKEQEDSGKNIVGKNIPVRIVVLSLSLRQDILARHFLALN